MPLLIIQACEAGAEQETPVVSAGPTSVVLCKIRLMPFAALQGIHFKERDRPKPPLTRVAAGLSQSTSLHSVQDVLQDWQNLDYAFLSPIFDSISKEGYMAAGFKEQDVMDALQTTQMDVYALGGVSLDKLHVVHRMGFKGVGLLGAVWAQEDPVASLQEFLNAVCLYK